jgi:hypothetical protein
MLLLVPKDAFRPCHVWSGPSASPLSSTVTKATLYARWIGASDNNEGLLTVVGRCGERVAVILTRQPPDFGAWRNRHALINLPSGVP